MSITINHETNALTATSGSVTVNGAVPGPTLVSGTSIKTVNSTSLLGSGDIPLFAGGLTSVEVVTALPGSPVATTLYIVTGV